MYSKNGANWLRRNDYGSSTNAHFSLFIFLNCAFFMFLQVQIFTIGTVIVLEMDGKRCTDDNEILDLLENASSDEDDVILSDEGDFSSGSDEEYVPPELEENEIEEAILEIELHSKQRSENAPEKPKKKKATKNLKPIIDNNVDVLEDDSNNPILLVQEEELIAKSGFVWKTQSNAKKSKTPAINVVHIRPGPTPQTNYTTNILECFLLFFSDELINDVLKYTNIEIEKKKETYKVQNNPTISNTCVDEIKAIIGLIILSAAVKSNHLSTHVLFDERYSGNTYSATLSKNRFEFLINSLRFDNRATRDKTDKLAPVRSVWEILLSNCRKYYKPSSFLTIDEQLIGFRGRCPFKMYIPSKPDKYGMKLIMMCDNATKYMLDAIPYTGKGCSPKNVPAAQYFVEKLVSTVSGSKRNITMDNWFTSVPLFLNLRKKHSLTALGTVKKNKPELPNNFKSINYQDRKPGTSFFLFAKDISAVSYKPKHNKLVCLLSTLHNDNTIGSNNKPEHILTYNQTKGGVDVFDQLCHGMNCIRKSKRWPMCYFYNMINIASINAYVIFCHNFYKKSSEGTKVMSRFSFMCTLADMLIADWLNIRLGKSTQHTTVKKRIETLLATSGSSRNTIAVNSPSDGSTSSDNKIKSRKICRYCPYSKRRMTKTVCHKCSASICGEHQLVFCKECNNN